MSASLALDETYTALLHELDRHRGKSIVVKIGGNSLDEDPAFLPHLAAQLAFLQRNGIHILLVHGGGPQIDRALAAAHIVSTKGPDGRRMTSPAMMDVIEQVMGDMSRSICATLTDAGCVCTLLPCCLRAKPVSADLGQDRTGMPAGIDPAPLTGALQAGRVVVANSLGRNTDGLSFNVNADDAAMALAIGITAERLILATNVPGVLDGAKNLISRLTPRAASDYIRAGVIAGGMIPKVESAVAALDSGVGGVAIIPTNKPMSLLIELLSSDGSGTLITADT